MDELNNHETIPLLDLASQFEPTSPAIHEAIDRVLRSSRFILGPEVDAFEEEMANGLGHDRRCVGTSSGTSALQLALMASDVGPGDEVIVPAYTFVATASVVRLVGATPVFVDVHPDSLDLDPQAVSRAISPRTRAVVPVHLFGYAADINALVAALKAAPEPVIVVEDAAQSQGATLQGRQVGTMGDYGCFSFFPSKNLGGFGDGGLVATTSARVGRVRSLRAHGAERRYEHLEIGLNARLDALQAAILRVRLPHVPYWLAARRQNAADYRVAMEDIGLLEHLTLPLEPVEQNRHTYNQFVVRLRQRAKGGDLASRRGALRDHLTRRGIQTAVYYPKPLPQQPCFADLGYRAGQFPVSESAAASSLALPVYPGLSSAQKARVVEALASFFRCERS